MCTYQKFEKTATPHVHSTDTVTEYAHLEYAQTRSKPKKGPPAQMHFAPLQFTREDVKNPRKEEFHTHTSGHGTLIKKHTDHIY